MSTYKYMVCTRCMTYNHAPYITDTMNGFCMQQTTFPFVCVIVDDASTDAEPEVIEKYLQENFELGDSAAVRREETNDYRLLFAQHKTNKNCYFAVFFLKYNHYLKKDKYPYYAEWADSTKYIAICEGDDYWTDPYKLQKQVDFLESHQEYDMVCARFSHLMHETKDIQNYDLYDGIIQDGADGMELKHEHFMYAAVPHPCTVMYRNGTLYDNPLIAKLKYKYDIPVYYCFMTQHRVWLMNQMMSVYRKHVGSQTDAGIRFTQYIYYAYADIYQYMPEDKILRELCAKNFRGYIAMPNAEEKSYNIKTFFKDYWTYLSYRPTIRRKLSFIYKVLRTRIRM